MKKKRKRLYILAAFVLILIAAPFPAHKWAKHHVDHITASEGYTPNCVSCHVSPKRNGMLANFLKEDYLSPFNIAVSSDGRRLYSTAQEANALLAVDLATQKVISQITVGVRPHSIVLDSKNETAYVSNQWSNTVSVIDLKEFKIIDTLIVGGGPAGLAISQDDAYLYVVNSYSHDISIVDLNTLLEKRRLIAGNNPTGAQMSPDGKRVLVTSRRTLPVPFRAPPQTELTILDTKTQQIADRKIFTSAHIMENVAFTPEGDLALVTLVRPKNLLPSTQIEKGWMMNHGIGVLEMGKEGMVVQLLLDEPNAHYADPFDIVVSPDGKRAFVSHSGSDIISVIDIDEIRSLLSEVTPENSSTFANHLGLSGRFVTKRIRVGNNPKGLAFSPDGTQLYVAERLGDRISVIDANTLEIINSIDLGGPENISMVRRGAQLFHNAGHTFHNQFSCYSCHPDGHEDGLTYDLTGTGRNLTNVQTLRDLEGTSPFKWNGKNVSVYMQCGMRFSKFVTRTESFSPENLYSLVAYIKRDLTHPPNFYQNISGELTSAQKRGKILFERSLTNDGQVIPVENRCITCHPPPNFTDRKISDVGTQKDADDSELFDPPNLNNVYESAPYLHDGIANTLEEIWTRFNDDDEHGLANDMTKDQLNDLVEYLKGLGPARTYKETKTDKAHL